LNYFLKNEYISKIVMGKEIFVFFLVGLFLYYISGCSLLHKRAAYDNYVNRSKKTID